MTTDQLVIVSKSQPTQGPGFYSVITAGVTLTLEAWTYWPSRDGKIIVKDNTGSFAPAITVAAPVGGAIDGLPTIALTNPKEALIFRPLLHGLTWSVTG